MSGCLIIGDSIAVGLHQQMPTCSVLAHVGISSSGWAHGYGVHPLPPQDMVVVSLGSNDTGYSLRYLRRIRDSITAKHVIWVLPACNEAVRRGIEHLAAYYRDAIVAFEPGKDGIHPRSYQVLKARVEYASG